MKNRIALLVFSIMLVFGVQQLRAQDPQWRHQIEGEVGLQFPASNFGTNAPIGYGGVLTYYYRPATSFFISLAAGYHVFAQTSSIETDFIPITVGLRYNFTTKGIQPYAGLETGVYLMHINAGGVTSDSSNFGLMPKFGVRIPIEDGLDVDANLKYNMMFTSPDMTSYVGLNLGLSYTIDRLQKQKAR